MQVFVAGATGQTGRRVVEQLRRKGINVRAGVRDVKKAQSLGLAVPGGSSTGSVELVQFDVTAPQENIIAAIGNADAVVYVPLPYDHTRTWRVIWRGFDLLYADGTGVPLASHRRHRTGAD